MKRKRETKKGGAESRALEGGFLGAFGRSEIFLSKEAKIRRGGAKRDPKKREEIVRGYPGEGLRLGCNRKPFLSSWLSVCGHFVC